MRKHEAKKITWYETMKADEYLAYVRRLLRLKAKYKKTKQ